MIGDNSRMKGAFSRKHGAPKRAFALALALMLPTVSMGALADSDWGAVFPETEYLNTVYTDTEYSDTEYLDQGPVHPDIFEQAAYYVNLFTVGSGTATIEGGATIGRFGQILNLTATPAAGYVFAGWISLYADAFEDREKAKTTFTVPGANDMGVTDIVIIALFEEASGQPGESEPEKEEKPEEKPEELPEETPDDQPEDKPGDVEEDPEDVPDEESWDMPEEKPEDIPDEESWDMPGDDPKDDPDDTPEKIPPDRPEPTPTPGPTPTPEPVPTPEPTPDGETVPVKFEIPATVKVTLGIPYQLEDWIIGEVAGAQLSATRPRALMAANSTLIGRRVTPRSKPSIVTVSLDGKAFTTRVHVVDNQYSRNHPLRMNDNAVFSSTKRLFYEDKALYADIFLLNLTGTGVRGSNDLWLKIYEEDELITQWRVAAPWSRKTDLSNGRFVVRRYMITESDLTGIIAREHDLARGTIRVLLEGTTTNGFSIIPVRWEDDGVVYRAKDVNPEEAIKDEVLDVLDIEDIVEVEEIHVDEFETEALVVEESEIEESVDEALPVEELEFEELALPELVFEEFEIEDSSYADAYEVEEAIEAE